MPSPSPANHSIVSRVPICVDVELNRFADLRTDRAPLNRRFAGHANFTVAVEIKSDWGYVVDVIRLVVEDLNGFVDQSERLSRSLSLNNVQFECLKVFEGLVEQTLLWSPVSELTPRIDFEGILRNSLTRSYRSALAGLKRFTPFCRQRVVQRISVPDCQTLERSLQLDPIRFAESMRRGSDVRLAVMSLVSINENRILRHWSIGLNAVAFRLERSTSDISPVFRDAIGANDACHIGRSDNVVTRSEDWLGALLIDFNAVRDRAVIGIGIQRIGSDLVDFLTVSQPVTIGVRVVRIGFTRTCGSRSANRSRRSTVSVRVFLAIGQSITIGVGIERIGRGTRVGIGSET